ncbi:hypothetical protein [Neomicrococcus lactis]|uniref:Uncharacterized membrane protein HdeD (DUF308 family) n=1 Tax=Neomicrococcus lactis TaxID=732241 RepID=A0A7W9DAR7_9MICC|nr:hypothetical protein [Neomicrococcus lactis]MBB5597933.1 uncharacterized membrane protein HdeD (DUF308 family) [Neomicrococcus lactis]
MSSISARIIRSSGRGIEAPARWNCCYPASRDQWVSPWFRSAGGLFILLFSGLTVRLLVISIAVGLVINGIRRLLAFAKGDSLDARIANGAFGVSFIGFGILSLFWIGVTLLVQSLVFGAQLILTCIREARRLIATRTPKAPKEHGFWRRFARTTTAIVTLAVVIAAAVFTFNVRGGAPVVDEFYAAPRDVPETPGSLIRAEEFTRKIPSGAKAWRILYTTTMGDGTAIVASGLVVAPENSSDPVQVIAWSHGTTGCAQKRIVVESRTF